MARVKPITTSRAMKAEAASEREGLDNRKRPFNFELQPAFPDLCPGLSRPQPSVSDLQYTHEVPEYFTYISQQVTVRLKKKPYSNQKKIIDVVLECLENRGNAAIESPTGTGKTIPLLSATLGNAHQNKEEIPCLVDKITNSQLDHAVKEFQENCLYAPQAARIGSREGQCLHELIKDLPDINLGCRIACNLNKQNHSRSYTGGFSDIFSDSSSQFSATNPDCHLPAPARQAACARKDDLTNMTRLSNSVALDKSKLKHALKQRGCAFYASKNLAKTAGIVFMTYQYLLDPSVREKSGLSIKDCIIIIDEAHNAELVCRSSLSLDLKKEDLKMMDNYLKDKSNVEELKILNSVFKQLIREEKMVYERLCNDNPETVDNLYEANIPHSRLWNNIDSCYQRIDFLNKIYAQSEDLTKLLPSEAEIDTVPLGTLLSRRLYDLSKVVLILRFFQINPLIFKINFTINKATPVKVVMLSFECLHAGPVFKQIARLARSAILASGTLGSPKALAAELNTKFRYVYSGGHIIDKSQVFVAPLRYGANETNFDLSYDDREKNEIVCEVGQSIKEIVYRTPGNVLCFVSSYKLLDTYIAYWESSGIFIELAQRKKIFVEPRDSGEKFELAISEFKGHANAEIGAIMFAIFRGKLSEGVDFRDSECRCLITVGIPFSNNKQLKIKQKISFNYHCGIKNMLDGRDWYFAEASRPLLQAVGRSIRGRNDWSAIVLLDSKYTTNNCTTLLSRWLFDSVETHSSFSDFLENLTNFMLNNDPHNAPIVSPLQSSLYNPPRSSIL